MMNRLIELGLTPSAILIDGSFVTGREEPGDVDFAALIEPNVVETAFNKLEDDHDKEAIFILMNPKNQSQIRALFGAHLLVADCEEELNGWGDFFRMGNGTGLRSPDPKRDPAWVKVPRAKGILKVYLDGGEI